MTPPASPNSTIVSTGLLEPHQSEFPQTLFREDEHFLGQVGICEGKFAAGERFRSAELHQSQFRAEKCRIISLAGT